MQLGYTPDYSEMISVSRIAARRIFSPWQRYWCYPYYVLVGFGAYGLGVVVGNFLRPEIGNQTANLLVICIMVVGYVAGAVIGMRLGRSLTARWLRKNKPERPVLFSVGPEGLQWQQNETLMRLGFADIDKIVVNRSLVGFLTGTLSLYVPNRAFESAEQIRTLVQTVFERMSGEARERLLEDVALRSLVTT
jgi:hypothetical protein